MEYIIHGVYYIGTAQLQDLFLLTFLFQICNCCLCRCQSRDWYAERRAGHIVQTDFMTNFYRGRVTAMLAAYTGM